MRNTLVAGLFIAAGVWIVWFLATRNVDRGLATMGIDHSWAAAAYAFISGIVALPSYRGVSQGGGWLARVLGASLWHVLWFVFVRVSTVSFLGEERLLVALPTTVAIGMIFVFPVSVAVLSVWHALARRKT